MPFVVVPSTENLARNQLAKAGESVGRQLDFYTVRTLLDITAGVAGSDSQNRLNALIRVIGTRSQPVIVDIEAVSVEVAPADLTDAAAGPATSNVYTLKFAIEHAGAWEGSTPNLKNSIIAASAADGVTGFVAGNLSVTFNANL